MEFKLNINMDNAAFDISPETEINFILTQVGQKVLHGEPGGKIQDSNGNTVGKFEFTED